jgi:hypothetical protein
VTSINRRPPMASSCPLGRMSTSIPIKAVVWWRFLQISVLDDLDDGGCRRWGFRVELASTGPMKLIVIFII